jgi:hypothetical protein
MLYSYSAPVGAVITIVPVAVVQVGWIVTLAVAAAGTAGLAVTVTEVGLDIHVGSVVLLTRMLCATADKPVKVGDS